MTAKLYISIGGVDALRTQFGEYVDRGVHAHPRDRRTHRVPDRRHTHPRHSTVAELHRRDLPDHHWSSGFGHTRWYLSIDEAALKSIAVDRRRRESHIALQGLRYWARRPVVSFLTSFGPAWRWGRAWPRVRRR